MAGSAKYQPYPAYKPSGVEWLGDIPEGWTSSSLRWLSTIYSGGTPSKTVLEYWENGTIPWLNSGAVNEVEITKPSKYITEAAFDNSSAKWVPKNGLVIALAGQGKTKGMVAITKISTTCNQSMAAIIINEKHFSKFQFWWITSCYDKIRNLAGGDLRDGLNLELLGGIPCPLPPLPEQTKISAFLDYETAKIDALIAKQERLIALLEEKRQAVISHAVTKGLDPTAPLRPSGIDWLGDVPAHWEVLTRIKYISSLKGRLGWQGLKADEYIEDGPYVVSSAHFREHKIQWDTCPRVSQMRYELDSNIQLAEGDLLLMKDGAAMGKLAFVDKLPDRACLNSHLLLFRPLNSQSKPSYDARFMYYFMQTDFFQGYIKVNGTGSTFLGISQQAIGNFRLVFPSIAEQRRIRNFLDNQTAQMDGLVSKAQSAIALMRERRTALIFSAVTGKIDLRGWQVPSDASDSNQDEEVLA